MGWGRTFSVQEQEEFFKNRASSKATIDYSIWNNESIINQTVSTQRA